MTKELTPKQKALRQRIAVMSGRIGGVSRTLRPGYDGREATKPATEAYWARLEAEVDPDGVMSADKRRREAKKLWRLRMEQAQLKRAQAQMRKAG